MGGAGCCPPALPTYYKTNPPAQVRNQQTTAQVETYLE